MHERVEHPREPRGSVRVVERASIASDDERCRSPSTWPGRSRPARARCARRTRGSRRRSRRWRAPRTRGATGSARTAAGAASRASETSGAIVSLPSAAAAAPSARLARRRAAGVGRQRRRRRGAAGGRGGRSRAAARRAAPGRRARAGVLRLQLDVLLRSPRIAVGAAFVEPNPECSFRTTTTISGSSAGANAANQAWSRSKYGSCRRLEAPRAELHHLRRAGLAGDGELLEPLPVRGAERLVHRGEQPLQHRVARRLLDRRAGRAPRGANSCSTLPSASSTRSTTCGFQTTPVASAP